MVETVHVQWKIAKIGEKQHRMAKISLSYSKSMSLNQFSVRCLKIFIHQTKYSRWRK